MAESRFILQQDRRGMVWDLLLYVPTVVALSSMAAKFWFGGDVNLAYLFVFLASFFCIAGANRVLKTRLMMLPSSPVAIDVEQHMARLLLRNGSQVELLKDLRYFPDYSGRTFGLTGMNGSGQRLQFVFHKGQFSTADEYRNIQDRLKNAASQ
jgi:hypothetical protein